MKTILATSLAAALLLLAGCATPPAAAPPPAVPARIGPAEAGTFQALDPASAAAVRCPASEAHVRADGRLELLANLENTGAKPAALQVQAVFAAPDGSGAAGSAWRPVALAPHATETVRFDAPDPAGRLWLLRARTGP
ncbi:MAG TPA: hypothetical protein VHC86_13795 [Opitutaceae bacterium]|nr:hypothetical protein [Opitutaceae bacterium]